MDGRDEAIAQNAFPDSTKLPRFFLKSCENVAFLKPVHGGWVGVFYRILPLESPINREAEKQRGGISEN